MLTKIKFAYRKNLLTKFAYRHNLLTDFAYCQENLLTMKQPCRLGWIITIAKILASCKSEQGWRANATAPNGTAGTCMGRTFQESLQKALRGHEVGVDGFDPKTTDRRRKSSVEIVSVRKKSEQNTFDFR